MMQDAAQQHDAPELSRTVATHRRSNDWPISSTGMLLFPIIAITTSISGSTALLLKLVAKYSCVASLWGGAIAEGKMVNAKAENCQTSRT